MSANNSNFNKVQGQHNNKVYDYSSPVNFNMGTGVLGSYDNILLKTQCTDDWKSPPCNPPLKSNLMFLPQGTPLPLKNEMIYSELPTDSMFIFANNPSSPFCSSSFSTDRGQVCTGSTQRTYLGASRGFNKTYENYGF